MKRKINKENEDIVASNVSVQKCKEYNVIIDADGEEWLTAEGAAAYLHLSVSRIYQIKNYLTHRKGNSRQSRVFFLKRKLFEDYLNI